MLKVTQCLNDAVWFCWWNEDAVITLRILGTKQYPWGMCVHTASWSWYVYTFDMSFAYTSFELL
jgi:hypothetical protein